MELRSRTRQPGESLDRLHQDIRRFMALAFDDVESKAREKLACDYFINALNDADLAMKVRERNPKTLDDALYAAEQIEVWLKDTQRMKQEEKPQQRNKNVRSAVANNDEIVDRLKDYIDRSLQPLLAKSNVAEVTKSAQATLATKTDPLPASNANRTERRCYNCDEAGHLARHCPKPRRKKAWQRFDTATPSNESTVEMATESNAVHQQLRGLNNDHRYVYIPVRINRSHMQCTLDTGSDVTVMPMRLVQKFKLKITESPTKGLRAVNGTSLKVDGCAKVPLVVGDRLVPTTALVSRDVFEFIIGSDWLATHNCNWDFRNARINVDGGPWVQLNERRSFICGRIYVDADTSIPPRVQCDVPVRLAIPKPSYELEESMLESRRLRQGLYVGRTLLPAGRQRDIKVCLMNVSQEEQFLREDTCLGTVSVIEVVGKKAAVDTGLGGNTSNVATSSNASGNKINNTSNAAGTKAGSVATSSNVNGNAKDNKAGHEICNDASNKERNEMIGKLIDKLPEELTPEQKKSASDLLRGYADIFSSNEYDIGRTPLVEHHIDTRDHRPIRQPLRRHPIAHQDAIDRQVEEMLRNEIIEPAASPWASNVVLIRKRDGGLRFCIDYRAVNSATYYDTYPLPRIESCLDSLHGAKWFSTLDLRAGYYNIPVAEQDRDKTAFVTRRGCWRFKVMPFGLTCAPSVCQRLMDMVLAGLSYEACLVYLDDIIIFGKSFHELLQRTEMVFQRIRWAKLKLKPSKCSLFARRVSFLGFIVSEAGIEAQPEKIKAVAEWPTPNNLHDLRSFLGLCGYYRRFVAGFSSVAAPLHALTRKGAVFKWTEDCNCAFRSLKHCLTTAPVLSLPTDEGRYVLDTDASNVGLGAILSQTQEGEEKVIAYASRTLSRTERNYDTTKKELLAVKYGLKQYRQYLIGRQFVVRTDHAALSWLRRTPEPMPQLARWLTFIEEFTFEVQHRAGVKHQNADALSRRSDYNEVDSSEEMYEGQRISVITTQSSVTVANHPATLNKALPMLSASAATQLATLHQVLPTSSVPVATHPATLHKVLPTSSTNVANHPATLHQVLPTSSTSAVNQVDTLNKVLPTQSSTVAEPLAGDNFVNEQLKDPDIGPVLRMKQNSEAQPPIETLLTESEVTKIYWSQWDRLTIHNGILCRRYYGNGKQSNVLQMIVPATLRDEATKRCHTGIVGGHLGAKKTTFQVGRRFYWHRWKSDVTRFCRRCVTCNSYHRGKLPRSAPLQPIVAGAPFERMSIDLTGPHCKSDRHHIWIMTCVDPYTKWAEAFPLRNKEAETVARVLVEQVFTRFGTPIALLSDCGNEVDSSIMRSVCKLLGIDKMHTTSYRPSTNSAAERFHRTLNSMLGKVVSENQKDWDTKLPFVMAAYRASRHESTGYSPNFLVLGRDVRTPLDVVLNLPVAEGEATNYDDYVSKLEERLRYAYSVVKSHLGCAAERAKKYYDLRVKRQRYAPGDWVYYYNPRHFRGRQDKWSRKFSGPFLVLSLLPPVNLKIQRSPRTKPFIVHSDRVKPWTGDVPTTWLHDESEPEQFEVVELPEAIDVALPLPEADRSAIATELATEATPTDEMTVDQMPVTASDEMRLENEGEIEDSMTVQPGNDRPVVEAPTYIEPVVDGYEADEVPPARQQRTRRRPARLQDYYTE